MIDRLATLALTASVVFFVACSGGGPGPAGVTPHASGWTDRTDEWGLDFVQRSGGEGQFHLAEIMGAGVALFDADGDGDPDLYLTNGNADPARGGAGEGGPANAFFRNEGGRFIDATESSGLGDRGYGMGVATGDVDNDGDVDLFVANFGPDRLYLNDGTGRFTDATRSSGLEIDGRDTPRWSSSALFLDYDADGWLDLFVAGYVRYRADKRCTDTAGRDDYCGPSMFAPEADRLWRNRGDGTFEDVSQVSGLGRGAGRGLGVAAFDADGDGLLDLYVANDGDPNHLWIQQDDGSFADEALLRGVAYNLAGETEAGMGVVAEDFDGNGEWDLFVTHLAEESNTLYVRGGPTFRDRSAGAGLATESMPFTGFGTAAVDLEADGDLDLLVVNGRVSGGFGFGSGGSTVWQRFAEPDRVFRNNGNGVFSAEAWGAPAISRGLATGDLDADGDIDCVVANVEGRARVWLQESSPRGHWLGVRALLETGPRDALGAEVLLEAAGRTMRRRVDSGGGYLSSVEPLVYFGLGSLDRVEMLKVRWPGGVEESFEVPEVDRVIVVMRGTGSAP